MRKKPILGSLLVGGLAFAASAQILGAGSPATKIGAGTAVVSGPLSTPSATSQPLLGVSATWPLTTPVPAPVAGAKVAPAMVAPPIQKTIASLPPLDLSTTWLWNWGGKWVGSEWANVNSPLPWKFNHIKQLSKADTLLTLDAAGAPQLQGGGATPARTDGLWEAEVTLPQLREGLVVAPLWIYDSTSRDEIDFEFAGKRGLDVTMHVYVNGVHKQNTVRLFAGTDMSGQRKRFGIKVDQATGRVDMFLDGKQVHRWEKKTLGYFVSKPLKPWIEMWAANPSNNGFVQWVGKWTPLAPGQVLTMRVHGYGYSTLAGVPVK